MVDPVFIIDTREQRPYQFSKGTPFKRKGLPAGDYSLEGWETRVAVERKTLDDLVGTVIRNRQRFQRELTQLQSYQAACVVVEANLADVFAQRYRSRAHPNAVFGSVIAICVDYGIPVFFCSTRQAACRFVERFLMRCFQKDLK